jgi:hypothetical protein
VVSGGFDADCEEIHPNSSFFKDRHLAGSPVENADFSTRRARSRKNHSNNAQGHACGDLQACGPWTLVFPGLQIEGPRNHLPHPYTIDLI